MAHLAKPIGVATVARTKASTPDSMMVISLCLTRAGSLYGVESHVG